ncbi:MAG: diguanylate cyclase [Acidobacteriota bacterium]|nr:diguanylate cyclase [Acidobacteriota bacterium]
MAQNDLPPLVFLSRQEYFQDRLSGVLDDGKTPLLKATTVDELEALPLPGLIIIDHGDYREELPLLLETLKQHPVLNEAPTLLVVKDFSSFSVQGEPSRLDACPMVPELVRNRVFTVFENIQNQRALDQKRRKLEETQERLENEIRYHKETERILSENERTLRRIFHSIEATGEAILITERNEVVYYVNPAFCNLTGFTEPDVFGCTADQFFVFDKTPLPLDEMKQVARESGAWRGDVTLKRKDGSIYEAYLDLTSVVGMKGEFEGFIFIQRDISALKKVMAELERLARIDALTGLYNRRYFMERFNDELERARRYGHPTSLLLLDMDHFKRINDSYGHGAGDMVLERVGSMVNGHMRSMDLGGRYGGEELCIALPETPKEGAFIFAERLRIMIAQEIFKCEENNTFQVTCSIGLAQLDAGTREPSEHINRADKALYRAKQEGRNRVVVSP